MVLVDGYNAIRRLSSLARIEKREGLEAGRNALVAALLASGVLRDERVVVVFDGARGALPSSPSPHPRLALRYAAAPRTADEAIVGLVAGARKRDTLVVVTADREIEWRVRELGAAVLAPELWEGLRTPKRPRARRPAPGADRSGKPTASRREVDYWLRVFGETDGEEE